MEQYVTRIGDVTIQRVIPSGSGPPEPVRVMESEELLRAVKEEPIDDEDEEVPEEQEETNDSSQNETNQMETEEGKEEEEVEDEEEEEEDMDDDEEDQDKIVIKMEPNAEELVPPEENDDEMEKPDDENEVEDPGGSEKKEETEEDIGDSSKRKVDSDGEDESSLKKKRIEIDVDIDKKKISNLRRNIREVMDETQLDEATLAAQRQEAERLRRVQDQQKYIREIQRQIALNRQSKTQNRVISLLQGGSTSILRSSSSSGGTSSTTSGPSTVLVKVGSGQQQVLNRKTLEVLRGGKSVSPSTEPMKSGITRVTPINRPAMVTPSVSIAPVKPVAGDGSKKVSNDADVVTISSSSDSEDDCIVISEGEGEEEEEEDVDPTNSGMHTNDLYNIPDEQGRVLINVGKPENEPEIFLAPQIARVIKPHQIGGVRFLFDNVVESIERFNSSTGFGCILAHSMGLGKTLQVVSFCDVFLRETTAKTVMCIMPINTLQNWMAEFNMWLPTDPTNSPLANHGEVRPRNFGIYVLNDLHKTISSRSKVVIEWNKEGGVLLIGYEMYRQLSLKKPGRVRKSKKKPQVEEDVDDEKNKPLVDAMYEALVRPGPDLVICDEGHRIKNSHASISHALKQIRTKRRVVLTGYPLQNNLLEYWCMVDFVRPNYLGTKTEFSNMFERPIQNGQCIDSTPQDIRLMRYRAHVLHSLLEGFVQRRSHSVLRNTLPQKEEYVILVRMTPFQRKLYDTFMNEVVRTKAVPNPLKAFAVCCKIWNHPDILYNFLKKKEMDELQDLDLEETAALQQQQQHQTGPNSPRRPLAKEKKGKKEVKKAQIAPIKPEVAAPQQSQPPTPDIKQEDKKFEFPNSQPHPPAGSNFDYYPPPPPYSDMNYQYQRPPGMYYQGYYPENPGYYQGYDQGYSGYYNNFGSMEHFPSGPPKNEEKPEANSWSGPYPNIKLEKNMSNPSKDFESPPKPGYQEFYPIKEEKPDIKGEKQTFLCGFTGGQVSYNYRNNPEYPDYPPYHNPEYPNWNKTEFSRLPQNEQADPGGQDRQRGGSSAGVLSQAGMFNSPNQPETQQQNNINQERSPNQTISSQHSTYDRNHPHQNINDNQNKSTSTDSSQRAHSNQDHHSGSHSAHDTIQSSQQDFQNVCTTNAQQRRASIDNLNSPMQSMSSGGYRVEENNLKNSNFMESDSKLTQNNSSLHVMQPFNQRDSSLKNQATNPYGNNNFPDQSDFRPSGSNSDRLTSHQNTFNNQRFEQGHQSAAPNQQQQQDQSIQSLGGHQFQMLGSSDQNISSQHEFYGHGPRENLEHNMQNLAYQSAPERMAGPHQNSFGNQENHHNFYDNQNRLHSSSEHYNSNKQNSFTSHDPGSNQNSLGNQQMAENQRRNSVGQENANAQQNQRSDSSQGQQQQTSQTGNLNHERHTSSQHMYPNQRNENSNVENFSGNQNKHAEDKQGGTHNAKQLDQPNMFANQMVPEVGKQDNAQPNHSNLNLSHNNPQIHQEKSSHNFYTNQDSFQSHQGFFKGIQDNSNSGQNSQNYFGSHPMGHGMHTGLDHQEQNSLGNLSNQMRMEVSSDGSGIHNLYHQSQNEHNIQKMISNNTQTESNPQHENDERSQHHFSMFSNHESQYANPESHHKSSHYTRDNNNAAESQCPPHMSKDKITATQDMHRYPDQNQLQQLGMFGHQNISDSSWMHDNREKSSNKQNMLDLDQQTRDNAQQVNQDKLRQFQQNQGFATHNQHNMYMQTNQHEMHSNTDQTYPNHQNVLGNAVHENQYHATTGQRGIESKAVGVQHDHASIQHGSPQNIIGRQNQHDNVQNNQNSPNSQKISGSQHSQQIHKGQDQMQSQHGMMGNMHGSNSSEPLHSNQQTHSGNQLTSQRGHYNQDSSQNISDAPNYGGQNNIQQKFGSHDLHQNPHIPMDNRNQNGDGNAQNMAQPSQLHGSSHSSTENVHTFSNQYHAQNEQQPINGGPQHGHTSQSQSSSQCFSEQMFTNQMSAQGANQGHNVGQGAFLGHGPPQNQNVGQGMHPSLNQHASQHNLHSSQPGSNSQQYHSPVSSHIQNNSNPPYSTSHHNQYLSSSNQQSTSVSSHNPPTSHASSSPQSINPKMVHSSTQAHIPNKNNSTPSKHEAHQIQSDPSPLKSPNSQNQFMNQQNNQSGLDHIGQNVNNQHKIQNMLGFPGQHHQSQNVPPFEQNVVLSKSMSGGQVLQSPQQTKHSMHSVLGLSNDSNRYRSFDDNCTPGNENMHRNMSNPGHFGQDYQFQYQGQCQFPEKQFPEHPGSGSHYQISGKDKDNENRQQKDTNSSSKSVSTSTSTETDESIGGKDKRDEEVDRTDKEKKEKTDTSPQKPGKEDPGIPYDWAVELLKGYVPGDISASAKMAVFFCIIEESIALGDRILVFSQSLFTLNLMEELLQQQLVPGRENEKWARNINYYRLDGSTSAMEREKLINEFNSNPNLHLFLVSTRAGSLGINLVGANRVIVFDASWNPCHDTQAVCRVYRYGQKKPCFVYRLVTDNCLEKKIYDRQINKQGMSDRVVDECNPDAHLSIKEVTSLCWDDKEDESPKDFSSLQDSYIDVVLQKVIQKHASSLSKEPFAHESLLVDRKETKLSQAEKRMAKRSYELEKQASTRPVYNGVPPNANRSKPMASVRPMQAEIGQGQRQRGWIPASVWQRQGMSAQEMTLPLDVVIPTNAADRASIVLKAGQKVMVLKSPKGIYMQLENGKIIAIRTAFKLNQNKKGDQGSKTGPGGSVTDPSRRNIRQVTATRGRPVRAVGPVARPPPVSVTLLKKRPSEDDQTLRREEGSQSPRISKPVTPTAMDVTVTPTEKKDELTNPFTAAAAASLSIKQVSPAQQQTPEESKSENQNQDKLLPQYPVQSHTPQANFSHTSPISPQPQSLLKPVKKLPSLPQISVQPLKTTSPAQQPERTPVSMYRSITPKSPVHPQVSVQPQLPNQHLSKAVVQPQQQVTQQQPLNQSQMMPQQNTVQHQQTQHQPQSSMLHQPHLTGVNQPQMAEQSHHQHSVQRLPISPQHHSQSSSQPQPQVSIQSHVKGQLQPQSESNTNPPPIQPQIQSPPRPAAQPVQPQPPLHSQSQKPVQPQQQVPLSSQPVSQPQAPMNPQPQQQTSVPPQPGHQIMTSHHSSQPGPPMQNPVSPHQGPQMQNPVSPHPGPPMQNPVSPHPGPPMQNPVSPHNVSQPQMPVQSVQQIPVQPQSRPVQLPIQSPSQISPSSQQPMPVAPQPPMSSAPQAHQNIQHHQAQNPPNQYPMPPQPQNQYPAHTQQPPFSVPHPQKQHHYPIMGQQQFPLPQHSPQFPLSHQQPQFLPSPQQHPSFPMHPQPPQYALPPQMPQQPYPLQTHPQYQMHPHLQQPQYAHQFPMPPQPQFPLQHTQGSYDPPAPVANSMVTDQLS